MSIDAGDRWVEYEIEKRESVGRYMYDHREDYVSRSRYEKTADRLTKAKEIIRSLLFHLSKDTFAVIYETKEESIAEAEQFLKE